MQATTTDAFHKTCCHSQSSDGLQQLNSAALKGNAHHLPFAYPATCSEDVCNYNSRSVAPNVCVKDFFSTSANEAPSCVDVLGYGRNTINRWKEHICLYHISEVFFLWVRLIIPELQSACKWCDFVAERFRQSPYCSDVAGSNPGWGVCWRYPTKTSKHLCISALVLKKNEFCKFSMD